MTSDVRPATAADLPAVRALQRCLADPAPSLFAERPPGVTLVSTAEGDVPVGYVHAFAGDVAYVAELVVAPAHRREGRARRLLAALFVRLRRRGCRAVELLVAAGNEPALSLYEGLGFERRERLPDYYEDGDALRLRLSL